MDLRPQSISESLSVCTMDQKSPPTPSPNPRPTSSVYSDDVSIMTNLVRKVSEETRAQQYQTIACFMRENQTLEEELTLHRKTWNGTIMLANEVIKSSKTIKRSLITVDANVASAEKEWLAFWGIIKSL